MATQSIPIRVSQEAAQIYNTATAEQQRKLETLLSLQLTAVAHTTRPLEDIMNKDLQRGSMGGGEHWAPVCPPLSSQREQEADTERSWHNTVSAHRGDHAPQYAGTAGQQEYYLALWTLPPPPDHTREAQAQETCSQQRQ